MGLDFKNEYRRKLVGADDAVRIVRSGDLIDYGFGLNMPNVLDAALAKRKDELRNVTIRVDFGFWPHHSLEADSTGEHFKWISWHFSPIERKFYEQGKIAYIPMKFFECPRMIKQDCDPCRVVMLQTGPMDRHGYFNFGLSATALWEAIETAEHLIIEINENMPRVLGCSRECVHISRVTHVVEGPNPPLPVIPDTEPTAVEKRIAGHVLPHIHDGSCIQLGVGGVPAAIGTMISHSDLKDLGVHTEMYVDAFRKMTEAGKINGARKNIDRYKQVMSFALGSRELYDFLDDNPGIIAYPVEYTNNVETIAKLDNFISVNACIEVDLFGQVCSESIGTVHYGGTGGQLDFVNGAYLSRGGQSFICMTSTYSGKDGAVSRIRPILTPGAIVTDPRTSVHKIATEFGVANLKGKSTWDRAEALVAIAHPDYRDELVREAEKMKIWRASNKIGCA